MGLQAIWRWSGAGRGVLLCAVSTTLLAAEGPEPKSKVTFSDAKTDGVRVDIAIPSPLFQRSLDFPRRGGSSLDGVGAVPFAPMPNMLPGAMSRREREARDAQNNWILDPGKGLAITEENANRAFGVRSPETQWTESENQRPTGFWEAYFGKKDHSKDALRARPAIETQAREKERTGFDPLGHFQPPGVADTDDTRLPFADRLRAGVLFSDTPSQSPALGTLADALDDTRRDLVREHLSFKFNPTSLSTKPEAAAAARAEQFRRILGVETPTQAEAQGAAAPKTKGAAGLAESGTGRNPLGSKDLIGVAPDPTRTELNPVVARPAPETGIGSPFSLPDSMSGLSSPRTAQRRSFLDASPIRSLQPLGANADLGSPNPTRRTTYSPTTLEIPRRSF